MTCRCLEIRARLTESLKTGAIVQAGKAAIDGAVEMTRLVLLPKRRAAAPDRKR